ncbi:LysR family transcriptional regulator [Marinomonas algicola]|uniref:LysR family transcriptional regulator n=1 Tax=Marinomonas algicola TaxID=2773454 RepID=UPI00174E5E90|nr:LysR family transcriptional regulator [Marinomonas algicola]
MQEIKLSEVDLNLLYILQVLIEELNVTKAAQRLNVSQPAVSRSLSRLREVFGDPLFVRTSHGLSLTSRTESLAPFLTDILKGLENLIQPPEFTPLTSSRRFSLSTTDFGVLTVLPKILDSFRQSAPHAVLEVKNWNEETSFELDSNEIDVAVAVLSKEPPNSVRSVKLDTDKMVCIARANHDQLEGKLTLESYVNLHHAQVVLGKRELAAVDRILAKMGHQRHIAVQLPNFVPAVRVVESSDLLLTVPKLFASDIISLNSNLAVYDLPFETKEFDYSMIWHERYEFDPGHQWLRGIIQQAFI